MKPISTKVHAVYDYLAAATLLFLPAIGSFEDSALAARVPVFAGIAILLYSLVTRYELSLVKLIPVCSHLTLDVLVGLVLVVSPWVFRFSGESWKPHVVVGLLHVGITFLTRPSGDVRTHRMGALHGAD